MRPDCGLSSNLCFSLAPRRPLGAPWGHGPGFARPSLSLPGGNLRGWIHASSSQPPRRRRAAPKFVMAGEEEPKAQGPKEGGLLSLVVSTEGWVRKHQDRLRSTGRLRLSLLGVISSVLAATALFVLSLSQRLLAFLISLMQPPGRRSGSDGRAETSPAMVSAGAPSTAVAQPEIATTSARVPDASGSDPAVGGAGEREVRTPSVGVKTGLGQVTEQDLVETQFGGKRATQKEVNGMIAMKERVLSLTKEERAAMCEPWLDGLTPTDLLRYIRGNGHKVQEATDKLLQSARWRKEYNVSSILSEHASSIEGFFPSRETREVDWLDDDADLENGRPSLLYRSAVHTPAERKSEEWVRFFVHQCEWARVHYPSKQVLVLVDRVGSGLSNQDPTVLRALAPVILDHYPDTIGRVLIAPVNTVLFVIWGLVSLILDETTKRRMKLLKGKEWKAQMVTCIYQDALPERLGGKNKSL